eukprot:scaffold21304_cov51-Phaeocystis_antarctica.AAC.1
MAEAPHSMNAAPVRIECGFQSSSSAVGLRSGGGRWRWRWPSQRAGRADENLADVRAARHVVKRRVDLRHLVGDCRQLRERWQRGLDLVEQRARGDGRLQHEHVEVGGRVCEAAQEGLQPDGGALVRVALADLDEASEGAEQAERGGDVFSGERVEDHVHPRARRHAAHARHVGRGVARMEGVRYTEPEEQLPLGGRGGSRVDSAAGAQAEVHRRQADAAGCRVDEHRVAARNARLPQQREPGGRVGHRTCDRLLWRGGGRRARDPALLGE